MLLHCRGMAHWLQFDDVLSWRCATWTQKDLQNVWGTQRNRLWCSVHYGDTEENPWRVQRENEEVESAEIKQECENMKRTKQRTWNRLTCNCYR